MSVYNMIILLQPRNGCLSSNVNFLKPNKRTSYYVLVFRYESENEYWLLSQCFFFFFGCLMGFLFLF